MPGLRKEVLAAATIIIAVAVVALATCSPHQVPCRGRQAGSGGGLATSSSRKVTVAVFYYVWYGDGLGGRHWNDSISGAVVDRPAIGYYSSINESVIKWQLNLMRKAGIDVVFISWWGPGTYEDRAAKEVFKLLPKYGLEGAILVEPFKGGGVVDALTKYGPKFWDKVLPYLDSTFISKYPDTYFRLNGKPLILTFAPVGLLYLPNTSKYVFRVVAICVDELRAVGLRADWDLWPNYLAPWTKPRENVSLRVRTDGYVAITPRFDISACRSGMLRGDNCWLTLDPTYSLGAYVKEWSWVLKHSREVRIVAIYSWNEYHERSEIEPHYDATKPKGLPYDPYNITVEFVAKLKGVVPVTASSS